MTTSLSVQMMLHEATERLAISDSPRLDAELLLSSVLGKPREFLYTWPEHRPSAEEQAQFAALLGKRAEGHPVAYLLGRREFWSLDLLVNEAVLIPRPDTERLVEIVLENCPKERLSIIDLGTGSGAIALALASERPAWSLTAADNSRKALDCAQQNRDRLYLDNVTLIQSNWCEQVPDCSFDVVVSNPPYIDPDDPHLQQGDLRFEPQRALAARAGGLADIKAVVEQSRRILKPCGKIFLEHGFEQAAAVQAIMKAADYENVYTWQDISGQDRVTGGQLSA